MNPADNPNRPTSTATLWAIGGVGGVIVAVVAFIMGGDDAEETRRLATEFGVWGIRLLLLGALVLGGWNALKRKSRQG